MTTDSRRMSFQLLKRVSEIIWLMSDAYLKNSNCRKMAKCIVHCAAAGSKRPDRPEIKARCSKEPESYQTKQRLQMPWRWTRSFWVENSLFPKLKSIFQFYCMTMPRPGWNHKNRASKIWSRRIRSKESSAFIAATGSGVFWLYVHRDAIIFSLF